MKAIVGKDTISELLIYGGVSCVFWTLTLQTTIKYIWLTLKADNNGEGGIFSLYALIRKRGKWLLIPALIGGSTLLADGIITPSISISAAVEGLDQIEIFRGIETKTTMTIVIVILSVLFFIQQFGTSIIGRAFGPMMLIWFSMLLILGAIQVAEHPSILQAISPHWGIKLLMEYPSGIVLLGAVFLCTTGAEALYSDLGHCGRGNIRVSWIFVKSALVMTYLGQSAYLISEMNGQALAGANPFYLIMPEWFRLIGVVIATFATLIASQALISGSFTLVNEAVSLNLWPKSKVVYPSEVRGQLFLPGLNMALYFGCVGIVLYFEKSHNMESAYGLAITLTMITTTILLYQFLRKIKVGVLLAGLMLAIYLVIEFGFLWANAHKFVEGGWVSMAISVGLLFIMLVWYNAHLIKRKYTTFKSSDEYLGVLKELSRDYEVPKYATHLVYLTASESPESIEWKALYSIYRKQPKRADIYWFVHVTTLDSPYTMEYKVQTLAEDDVVWVEFRLGFRVPPRINLYFRKVVEDMVKKGEVNITSRYPSLSKYQMAGDFRFVVLERFLSYNVDYSAKEKFILKTYYFLKRFTPSDAQSYGLDTSNVTIEKIPLAVPKPIRLDMKRVEAPENEDERAISEGAEIRRGNV